MLVYLVNEYTVRPYCLSSSYLVPMNSIGTISLEFRFDRSWERFDQKTAQFIKGKTVYNIMLDEDNRLYLPPVLDAGEWAVGVFGLITEEGAGEGDKNRRYTTTTAPLFVVEGGYRPEGVMPVEPPEDYYRKLIETVKEYSDSARKSAEGARTSEEECRRILEQFDYNLDNVEELVMAKVRILLKDYYTKTEIDENITDIPQEDIEAIIGG